MNIDRLAIGLTRQELSPLKKANMSGLPDILFNDIKSTTSPYFGDSKRLPENVLANLRNRIHSLIVDTYQPFTQFTRNVFVGDKQGDADCWFYWHPFTQKYDVNGKVFDDAVLELRFVRFLADRKRVILDNRSCRFTISEHVLVRMLQRAPIDDKPLAYCSKGVVTYLPLIPLYLMAHHTLEGNHGVALPTDDGMLMGNMSIFPMEDMNDFGLMHHRIVSDKNSIRYGPMINRNDTSNNEVAFIRVSTFISHDAMFRDKEWVYAQMKTLLVDNHDNLSNYTVPILYPEIADHPEISSKLDKGVGLLQDILTDPYWLKSCLEA